MRVWRRARAHPSQAARMHAVQGLGALGTWCTRVHRERHAACASASVLAIVRARLEHGCAKLQAALKLVCCAPAARVCITSGEPFVLMRNHDRLHANRLRCCASRAALAHPSLSARARYPEGHAQQWRPYAQSTEQARYAASVCVRGGSSLGLTVGCGVASAPKMNPDGVMVVSVPHAACFTEQTRFLERPASMWASSCFGWLE